MSTDAGSKGEIEALWNKFRPLPFGYSGSDNELRFELTSIDTFAVGCIESFIERRGHQDAKQLSVLKGCVADLEPLLGGLHGEAKRYFDQLLRLSKLVLDSNS